MNAYPLSWPTGWKRTMPIRRTRARFTRERHQLSVNDATERLLVETERLGAEGLIVSTNVELRLDGFPRANRPEPADPGVAVYFLLEDKRAVLACDRWDRVADNIAAIAAHIEAIRAQERYGVGTLEQAFRGYLALPAPNGERPWREVLPGCATLAEAEAKYRARAKECHPDMEGHHAQMTDLNLAIAAARKELMGS